MYKITTHNNAFIFSWYCDTFKQLFNFLAHAGAMWVIAFEPNVVSAVFYGCLFWSCSLYIHAKIVLPADGSTLLGLGGKRPFICAVLPLLSLCRVSVTMQSQHFPLVVEEWTAGYILQSPVAGSLMYHSQYYM